MWLFFRKCDEIFSDLQIFQKTILSLKFEFPANNSKVLLAGNLNFKLRIAFWNIFFEIWRSEKISSHFLKKSHLYNKSKSKLCII